MRQFDLSPLYRATVGFDRLSRALDAAARLDDSAFAYPPYNIEKRGEDRYRITMAVAGFDESDLELVTHEGVLTVKGRAAQEEGEGTFLHRGIARRAFERKFQLADYIRVAGARLENGLLNIELVREVPEAMKPRTIAIERVEHEAPAQVSDETRQAA